MAVLGLRFCARAFSNCGKWGPLFIAVRGPHYRGLSRCGAQAPDAQAQQLWLTGPVCKADSLPLDHQASPPNCF